VRDVMSTYIISIRPDDTVIAAATKMVAETISCLIVMDGEKVVGIITERDFLHKVPLTGDVFKMRVRDVMTDEVVTVKPEMLLVDAVKLMKTRNFRRLVVSDGARTIGIVTQNDLLRRAIKELRSYPVAPEFALDAIMNKNVLTATPKDTFARARERMHKRNVGCIVIVDKAKQVHGIFTEYDVVSQFYEQQGKPLRVREIDAFMRQYVRAMRTDVSVFIGVLLVLDKRIRRIPIAQGDKIIGIATETDLVRFLYLNLDKILATAEKDVEIRRLPKHSSLHGEFASDHLKVYGPT
jgi:CBS-domain-containing membrane protein